MSDGTGMKKHAPIVVLLAIALGMGLARLHTYNEPRSYDVTFFSVSGHSLLQGNELYSWIWDNKPPAPYITYALAELFFGYGPRQIYWIGLLTAIATMLVLYRGVFTACGRTGPALWAATFWGIATLSLRLDLNEPNCEAFINFFLAAALVSFFLAGKRSFSVKSALLTGVLFAAATMYKPFIGMTAIALCSAHFLCVAREERARALRDVLWIFTGSISIWVFVCSYFWATHRFWPFYHSVFTYNNFYNPSPGQSLLHAPEFYVSDYVRDWLLIYVPLLFLIIMRLGFGPRLRLSRVLAMLLAYCVATYIEVALPGRFYAHYFQLWLPPLVIAAGLSLDSLQQKWREVDGNAVPKFFAPVIVLLALCFALLYSYLVAPNAIVIIPNRWPAYPIRIWVPCALLTIGMSFVCLRHKWSSSTKDLIPKLLAATVVFSLVIMEIPEFQLNAYQSSKQYYYDFIVQTYEVSERIERILQPREVLLQVGDNPGFYFHAHRSTPTGILMMVQLEGPYGNTMADRVRNDIERTKPDMIVADRAGLIHTLPHPELSRTIHEEYLLLSEPWERFYVLVRKGSALEKRLADSGNQLVIDNVFMPARRYWPLNRFSMAGSNPASLEYNFYGK